MRNKSLGGRPIWYTYDITKPRLGRRGEAHDDYSVSYPCILGAVKNEG